MGGSYALLSITKKWGHKITYSLVMNFYVAQNYDPGGAFAKEIAFVFYTLRKVGFYFIY